MKKIDSFRKDHTLLKPGLYGCVSHGYVATYDLRFIAPNTGSFTSKVAHSVEHLLATYFKCYSSKPREVISFNIGACLTMGYLELCLGHSMNLKNELPKSIDWCLKQDTVPGATPEECGNYLLHDLEGAKSLLSSYRSVIESISMSQYLLEQFIANDVKL